MKSGIGWKMSVSLLLALVPALACLSCATAYYKTMETFGIQKRHILVDRIEAARDSQKVAGGQFVTALERFKEVVKIDGGDLEAKYDKLNAEYERSESRAAQVTQRIASVENVAGDLFKEWELELDQYTDPNLRRSSEKTLRDTRQRYEVLIATMKRAESKMPPVLARLKDQVLFLKHNLNARAIGSLDGVAADLQTDVDALLKDLDKAISEANSFINEMK